MLRTLLLLAIGAALVAADLPEIGSSTADVEAAFGVPLGNARARTSGRVVWSYQDFLAVFEDELVVNVIELPTVPAGSGSPATEVAAAKPVVAKAPAGKGTKTKGLDPSTLNDAAAKVNSAKNANAKKGGGKNGGASGQSMPPNLQQLLNNVLQQNPGLQGRMPRQP